MGLPDHIVYGLVREESYFDADVISNAGAVGLSQLMPSTASSVARGLGIVNPDLRDPTTNLTIGIRHFKDLTTDVDSMTKALLAYNAGLTRVRQWSVPRAISRRTCSWKPSRLPKTRLRAQDPRVLGHVLVPLP